MLIIVYCIDAELKLYYITITIIYNELGARNIISSHEGALQKTIESSGVTDVGWG